MNAPFDAVIAVLQDYFEGLYRSDSRILRKVFHPAALYACASDGSLLALNMEEYFAVVEQRPSPAGRGEARTERILSIDFIGPVTALARVQCSILPKLFTDSLTFVLLDGRWQLISKVFHYDLAVDAQAARA